MKIFFKVLSVFINLANYGVGIAVALILAFKWDFLSVFYFGAMSSNESLFVNMMMFQLGLLLSGIVLSLLVGEYSDTKKEIQFPTVFEILPVVISAISVYYGFAGETVREKIVVIACAILYSLLSCVIIFTGSKTFQTFSEK